MFFKQIIRNKFNPINFFKLYIDIGPIRLTIKLIKLKKNFEVNTKEGNIRLKNIKKLI